MCNINDKKEKEKKIRDTAEALYRKRYEGILEEHQDPIYPNFIDDVNFIGETKAQLDFGRFNANFIGAGVPRPREIFFTQELLKELDELSEENNVEISTLINCYLLQMLERNKRTTEHTKARKVYIKNSLYEKSTYIQKCETKEEFEGKVFDKHFIKNKEFSYKNIDWDEEIYIQSFLLNRGYTLDQIHQIEKEEKEIQGIHRYEEGEIMQPKTLHMEMTFKEVPALNYDYDVYLFIPARLGLHYILLSKVETLRSYQDIETFLISKSEGGKTIWDLYSDYLSSELI
jgi:hypothetical protein